MGKIFTNAYCNSSVVEKLEQQIDTFFADVLKEEFMFVCEPWEIKITYKKIKKLIDELKR